MTGVTGARRCGRGDRCEHSVGATSCGEHALASGAFGGPRASSVGEVVSGGRRERTRRCGRRIVRHLVRDPSALTTRPRRRCSGRGLIDRRKRTVRSSGAIAVDARHPGSAPGRRRDASRHQTRRRSPADPSRPRNRIGAVVRSRARQPDRQCSSPTSSSSSPKSASISPVSARTTESSSPAGSAASGRPAAAHHPASTGCRARQRCVGTGRAPRPIRTGEVAGADSVDRRARSQIAHRRAQFGRSQPARSTPVVTGA